MTRLTGTNILSFDILLLARNEIDSKFQGIIDELRALSALVHAFPCATICRGTHTDRTDMSNGSLCRCSVCTEEIEKSILCKRLAYSDRSRLFEVLK